MARRVEPHGHVFAFESTPKNFCLLAQNIESNGYAAIVTARRTAIADRSGPGRLALDVHNSGMHRLAPDGTVEVETTRPDDLLAGQRVDFVKIDIEGAEVAVLRGMRKIISANPCIRVARRVQ
ncbi:MAG: FkbM family methyltransferase [Alphaproteobacteria bacterium]|nr:FkbM family methyltransferase [Alphaproteobacteria bacterium]